MNKMPVSVIILTLNEEIHIKRCLENIIHWADEIFIVDSYSTDKTLEIAKKYGVKTFQRHFKNQAEQFNWALDNLKIKNEWILRLDADEYLIEELKEEITETLINIKTSDVQKINGNIGTSDVQKLEINGFLMKRRVYFMGRWIKHGGYYPVWFLRLFRKNKAKYEEREVDEHMVLLEGETLKLRNDFIDNNKQKLEWWLNKQNNHSSREVNEISNLAPSPQLWPGLRSRFGGGGSVGDKSQISNLGGQAGRKRWLKENFYYRLPLFCRAFLYFFYRYFFRLGFLDGKEGLIFHFLNACWYRFVVDAKLYEYQKKR